MNWSMRGDSVGGGVRIMTLRGSLGYVPVVIISQCPAICGSMWHAYTIYT